MNDSMSEFNKNSQNKKSRRFLGQNRSLHMISKI